MAGKNITNVKKDLDLSKVYDLSEAVEILKKSKYSKFDETVEVALKLGVNVQHSDQIVRGVVNLPNGTGKTVKVAVFARGENAEKAKAAGADIVGEEDLMEEITKGNINFDRCIATPDMMGVVGRVARILGPKGLMPNAKVGTVTNNVAEVVKSIKAGQVEFRAEKNGIVHAGVGKVSFSTDKIVENVKKFFEAINAAKPSGAKGTYMVRASVSTTMGPGVKLSIDSTL